MLLKSVLSENRIIYIANRLFDIEEKAKSEYLERAIISGVYSACECAKLSFPSHKITFVPFRDADQENLNASNKTQLLYEQDIQRLSKTALLVAYIDGLSKDEGVCFEIGFAFSKRIPILLISTDFISHLLPCKIDLPLDPLLCAAANKIIRVPNIQMGYNRFVDNLIKTRQHVLELVKDEIRNMMLSSPCSNFDLFFHTRRNPLKKTLFIDFGGELFEWQSTLVEHLSDIVKQNENIVLYRPHRYHSQINIEFINKQHLDEQDVAKQDIERALVSDVLVICSDSDECPAGSAFLQGMATGLGIETWLYSSKKTKITGPGGYLSSRNLMLDYSATHFFARLCDLVVAIKTM